MAKIRLLALDLDGTLTDSQKQVPEENRIAIRRAQQAGVEIVLASGRPVIGIRKTAEALSLYETGGYILAYNGGQIVDCASGRDLVYRSIPVEYTAAICEAGRRFDAAVLTYNGSGVISEHDEDRYVRLEAFNNGIPVFRVASLETAVQAPVVKYMIVGENERLRGAYAWLRAELGDKVNVFFSETYFLEVTPPGIEKAASLASLLQLLNVPRESLMACGDGLNDLPMLRYAGLSVAMENAYPEVKALAHYVTTSNDDCGVARAIERFILGDR